MKKVITTAILSGLVLSVFANCGKKDDKASSNAPADMAATCYFMQTNSATANGSNGMYPTSPNAANCNYNYSVVGGFTSLYGASMNTMMGAGYFSGSTPTCSGGQTLVYSPSKGLGCVSTNQLNISGQPVVYDLNRTTLTFTTVSTPNPYYQQQQQGQFSQYPYNNQNMFGYGNNGYPNVNQQYTNNGLTMGVQVLRVCDASENCPNGQSCRSPFGPTTAPALGICYF